MNRFLLVTILFFHTLLCSGQNFSFSIRAGANHSMTQHLKNAYGSGDKNEGTLVIEPNPVGFGPVPFVRTRYAELHESFTGNSGLFFGGKVNYHLSRRIFVTMGLSFDYSRFNRALILTSVDCEPMRITLPTIRYVVAVFGTIRRDDFGNPVINSKYKAIVDQAPFSSSLGDTEIFSVHLPFRAGVNFLKEKATIEIGFDLRYVSKSFEYIETWEQIPFAGIENETIRQERTDDFKRFTWGLNCTTTFKITKRIAIELAASQGLSALYQPEARNAGRASLSCVTAGVSYLLTRPRQF